MKRLYRKYRQNVENNCIIIEIIWIDVIEIV